MSLDTIVIREIITNGTKYNLKKPIFLESYRDGGYHGVKYSLLDIDVLEGTAEEALDAFYEFFDVVYEEYGLCPDEELASDAIELKRKVLTLVETAVKV